MQNIFIRAIVIAIVVCFCILYSLPLLYDYKSGLQLQTTSEDTSITQNFLNKIQILLEKEKIKLLKIENSRNSHIQIVFEDDNSRTKAIEIISKTYKDEFVIAKNKIKLLPYFLKVIGSKSLNLGLDLRGGSHFLYEADIQTAISNNLNSHLSRMKLLFIENKIFYQAVNFLNIENDDGIKNSYEMIFKNPDIAEKVLKIIDQNTNSLSYIIQKNNRSIRITITEQFINEIIDNSLSQNIIALRSRINELGLSEPSVQRVGKNRILIQLPGFSDVASAKRIIGLTSNLEFKIEASSRINATKYSFKNRKNSTAYLKDETIVTGEGVANANASVDEQGRPQVNITLDGPSGRRMSRISGKHINQNMGIVLIESKTKPTYVKDSKGNLKEKYEVVVQKSIISLANIRQTLGTQFRITGLTNREAQDLALLLRSGSLATPLYLLEDRLIGPSLGEENIRLGLNSFILAACIVFIFIFIYYGVFGIFANISLMINIGIILGVLSILSAVLTLPGIAGIILTVGMAVDGNIIIYSRIKEELKKQKSNFQAIFKAYNKAYLTILDANITTIIVAIILFAIGSGLVKGFAITLIIGILSSIFTSIFVTKTFAMMIYGTKKAQYINKKINIGFFRK